MKTKLIKIISFLACTVLAVGLTACQNDVPDVNSSSMDNSSSEEIVTSSSNEEIVNSSTSEESSSIEEISSSENNSSNNGKTIPVYQGMTISSTAETVSPLSISVKQRQEKNDNGNHYGHYDGNCKPDKDKPDHDHPFPDNSSGENIENEIEDSLTVVGPDKDIYYAEVNQDIYIHIHIHNPDAFEILSFTLNGEKYSSYMFEYGSTLNTLILKYNVGATSGLAEYTIDAIKYVDETTIKDVLIDGDQTVRAGIRRDNQVNAAVSNTNAALTEFSFHANVYDDDGLLAYSEGELKAVLYDGETLVATQDLQLGNNNITFTNLNRNTAYQYAVIGYYDNFQDGFGMNVLYKDTFYTKEIVLFDTVTISQESVDFTFVWYEAFENKTFTSLTLYQGESVVKTLDVTATSISELLSGASYKLVAEYQNGDTTQSIYLNFTTLIKATPTVEIINVQKTTNSVSFEINETDTDNIGKIERISLTHEAYGEIFAETINLRNFENLDLLTTNNFKITVYYKYNINDGKGEQEILIINNVSVYSLGLNFTLTDNGYSVTGIGNCQDKNLVIPKEFNDTPVVAIGDSAFSNCSDLTSITIPDTITSIGTAPFSGCTSLIEVLCPDFAIRYIPKKNLQKVIITSGNTIGDYAFRDCSSLTSITIPDSVTSIGNYAFEACSSLTSITIPNSVTSIGNSAFAWCSSLTSITIPDSVTSIGTSAFMICKKLTNIEVESTNVNFQCIDGNLYSKDGTQLIQYAIGKTSTSFIIPESVNTINTMAFSGCNYLVTLIISGNIQTISPWSLASCQNLTSITIGNNVTSIGASAFNNCLNLTEIRFMGTVTQWNNIEKGLNWNGRENYKIPATKVVCNDGEVAL